MSCAEQWQAVARRFRYNLPCAETSSADLESRASQRGCLGLNLSPKWKPSVLKQQLPSTGPKVFHLDDGDVGEWSEEEFVHRRMYAKPLSIATFTGKWTIPTLPHRFVHCLLSSSTRTRQRTLRSLKSAEEMRR